MPRIPALPPGEPTHPVRLRLAQRDYSRLEAYRLQTAHTTAGAARALILAALAVIDREGRQP